MPSRRQARRPGFPVPFSHWNPCLISGSVSSHKTSGGTIGVWASMGRVCCSVPEPPARGPLDQRSPALLELSRALAWRQGRDEILQRGRRVPPRQRPFRRVLKQRFCPHSLQVNELLLQTGCFWLSVSVRNRASKESAFSILFSVTFKTHGRYSAKPLKT